MQKLTAFTAAAAILLAGCAAKKSATWQTVRAVPHAGPRDKAPAPAYADRVHTVLRDAGVAHKVVTFKFRYRSRLLRDREGEETVVVYRDTATPAGAWWLAADRLSAPEWLLNSPLDRQLASHMGRSVRVVNVADFPARGEKRDGKAVAKPSR